MIPNDRLYLPIVGLTVALLAGNACRADLFAVNTFAPQLHRIDSNSGQILTSYDLPPGPTGGTIRTGLAFDGRTIYLSRFFGSPIIEIARFDVVDEVWLEPAQVFVEPLLPIDGLAGLGFRRDEDRTTLIGVNFGQSSGVPPVLLYEMEVFDSFPAGYGTPLPLFVPLFDEAGLGLDVDPETGDIWLATRQQPQAAQLLRHLDQFGNVLETLTLPFPNGSPAVRGVGFDHGKLFVADAVRNIYKIDRTNGSVTGSFTLPITGLVGGLTGGEVVPEPATIGLAAMGLFGIATFRRRRRS